MASRQETDRPLDTICGAPVETGRFLRLAVHIAAALAELHGQNKIHTKIEPGKILFNPETLAIKLTRFPAPLSRQEYPADTIPTNIEAMPAYMSPEQTGRMNRSVDHRTDLYSLGATFYEMLTGTIPFQASDILEWVHCHLARIPRRPMEVIEEIPPMLSHIVMKLLAKDPEARYQTASGLQYDLERCLDQWEAKKKIEPFHLGEWDISDRLLIPQRLYGRGRDVGTLFGAFDRVVESGKPEMVMVAGYSGIGKTSLVQELYTPVVRERGFFISGKFDQYKRDIPYSTVAEAFRELVQQILTESEERIAGWKRVLQEALGSNGQLIVDIIPQVELIVGPQLPVPEMPPTEARNRFYMVFRQFMGVFTKKEHPLVVFFDDLQWVDAASLHLLEQIITNPGTSYLLLIGAYRDNEVSSSHPLMLKLNEIGKSEVLVETITLSPLSFDDLGRLMADTFRVDPGTVEPLTRLVHEKTAGNPFFVIQFLTTLYEEGLLRFDRTANLWKWDIPRIREKGYTDNVVDLMVRKLKKLSAGTLRELTLAACIGNRFALHNLAVISGTSEVEALGLLREALQEGLLLQVQDRSYKFLHDRVQEAAYSLVPEIQRAGLCLRIGRLLLADSPLGRLEERVFDIVSQLNCGAGLITSRREREQVAELNLIAGKRARRSTAYASALMYLAAGTAFLAEDSWSRRYELTFALEFHRAECEYLTGELDAAEERLTTLSRHARSLNDVAAVTSARCDLYTTRGRGDRAVEVFLEYMRHIGVEWSPHPTKDEVRREFERMWRQLGSRPIEALVHLPPMGDPASRATIELMMWAHPPAQFVDENLGALVIGRMANLSLEHGNSDASSLAYVWLGSLLGSRFGDYEAGYRFGKVGLELVEKRGLLRCRSRVYIIFGALVSPHSRHFREGIPLIRRAYVTGLEEGDISYACYARNAFTTLLLAAGDPLGEVQLETENALQFVRNAKFGMMIDIIQSKLRLIRMLRGLTPHFSSFDDAQTDEARFERLLETDRSLAIAVCWYFIRKLQARYYAGDYHSALAAAAKAEALLWTSPSFVEEAEYHFYTALARAAHCDDAPADERPRDLELLTAHGKQLELWAKNCPENFQDRHALVSAELARIEGRELEAERLYEEAIRSARDNDFVQNLAMAFELASGFYRTRGFETIADAYLRNARACYGRWGADGKVKQLDAQYPRLQAEERASAARGIGGVDVITVLKASQAISGEMLLSNLLDTLMRIVIENAGAQKGCLLLVRGEELSVEAQAGVAGEEIKVLLEAPPRLASILPESIINYVRRTLENVILDDAAEDNVFSPDEYIASNKPVSVLCMPILRHAELIGLLYLENDSVKGAFTPDRITVLEALASQAAISLENSTLYAALDESRRLLQSIMDNSTAVIYVKDPEGRYLLVNRRFEELFHVAREAIAGKTDYDVFPKTRADAFRVFDRRVLAAGTVMEAEEAAPQDDGLHTYISIKAPLYDAAGNAYAVCGISTDITERKHAEEFLLRAHEELEQKVVERTKELSEANIKLQEVDRLKSMFIASMSHELRTPLNSVIGFSSILLNEWTGTLNEEQKENLAVILRSGKHLLALINDVIDVSKIEAGKIEPVIESFDIDELIAEAVNLIAGEARAKGLEVKVEATRLTMNTDRRRLLQCVINLLTNAVKFTEKGSVRLAVRRVNDSADISVEDTGIGLREEDMPKLFQPFIRHVYADTAVIPGTGLGLYLTKKLVKEILQGDIKCTSAYGRGSLFSVRLPIRIR